MRGSALAITIFSFIFCGVTSAQKVQFAPADKGEVLQRMKAIPESNRERAARLKQLFIQAGCGENFLTEQKLEGAEMPNIICRLGTGENELVIVGAHYERTSSPQRPLDNWSGAALLPVLYQSLRERKRAHSFLFVAFADSGNSPSGAESFVRHLNRSQVEH